MIVRLIDWLMVWHSPVRRHQGQWNSGSASYLVTEFLSGSAKAKALASVDDPDIVEKNSVPYKMLSSVIYDLGKLLGARYQLDRQSVHKIYFL